MRMKKPGLLLLFLLLVPALLALAAWAAGRQPGFSRSRWLEEQMAWGARMPENLVPEDPRRLKAFLDRLARTKPSRGGIPKGVVRVSGDILAPGGGPAQPETETEPFFAIDPENPKHLLASYQEDRFEDGGCRSLTSAVSFNGGLTWQESLLPRLTLANGGPYQRTSDPWVAFGTGGRAYFASLGFDETTAQNGVYLSSSDDGGRTWSDPVAVHSGTTTFDDKEAVVVDNRDDSPYKGRVYVGWDSINASRQQPELIAYSDDGGRSFQPPATLTLQGSNLGIIPLVGPGGIVHAVWLSYQAQQVLLLASHSMDGGQTWSAPVTVSDLRAFGVEGSRTGAGLPAAAVDGRTGAVYVAWEDGRFTASTDQIVLSRSTDGGQTWSAPQRVSDGPGDAPNFTPAVAVTPEGWVGVSYYSLRSNPSHVLVDEYLAVSKNGGEKFTNSRLTASSWDLRFAAAADGFFLGDYQGLAAASKTFYPLWIGTFSVSRLDPPARQPDAYTRAVKVK
ncbi:MAG TPA: sialidase family protein [Thermoanaerobaculia bacterium]|nr:sialidase family protein [Thermoanaerobaculia bacterium]